MPTVRNGRRGVVLTATIATMRRFIVTNPNLSVGKPGDIVTSDRLKMSDEQLDEWVAAGFGVEVHDDDPIVDPMTTTDEVVVELTHEIYDPGTHTVAEVLAYAADHPGEVDRIFGQELADRQRSGILDALVG